MMKWICELPNCWLYAKHHSASQNASMLEVTSSPCVPARVVELVAIVHSQPGTAFVPPVSTAAMLLLMDRLITPQGMHA